MLLHHLWLDSTANRECGKLAWISWTSLHLSFKRTEKVLKVLQGSRWNNGVLKNINYDFFPQSTLSKSEWSRQKDSKIGLSPSDAQGVKQAVHSGARRNGFHVWQQHYFSSFELLHLSSLSALPAKLSEQPSNELDQRADPSVKQPRKINGYFQMDPFPVLLSVQVPKQIRQHDGKSTAWTWMGSREQLSWQWHLRNTQSDTYLKYHKDKKAWHGHTSTGTMTLIPVLQHFRPSSEANLGSPCPSSVLIKLFPCWTETWFNKSNWSKNNAWKKKKPKRYAR